MESESSGNQVKKDSCPTLKGNKIFHIHEERCEGQINSADSDADQCPTQTE